MGEGWFFKASIQIKPLNETPFLSNRPQQFNESTGIFPNVQNGHMDIREDKFLIHICTTSRTTSHGLIVCSHSLAS